VKSNEATSGGGIIHFGGKLRILTSTIASNLAHFSGGGLEISDLTDDRSATAEAINSTISMNEAQVRGGGVYVFNGQAKFVHVTISSNVAEENGGGLHNEQDDFVTIKNTIIGDNYLTGFLPNDCFGTITSHSYNIISANTCNFISSAGDQVGTFSTPLDPVLDPLGDYNQGNGSPDMHALGLTSPAIDIVPRAECEKGDQRSFARGAVIYSSRTPCDAGAYERNAKPFCLGVLTPFVATIVGTSGDDVLMGTSGSDIIHGLGGDDQIKGLGAGDFICGGTGNDTIDGDDGSDVLFGQDGDDIVNGGANADVIWGAGEVGNNQLNGNGGSDTIVGGIGDDAMNGGAGRNDRCNGSSEFDKDTAVNCETVTKVP
jgi:Ca2+-binding RTX toxin-like protein